MASDTASIPHIIRTAKDPRQEGLHDVRVSKVDQVNSFVRMIQLALRNDGVGSMEPLLFTISQNQVLIPHNI
jgi:CHAD domain-containing protein